VRRGILPARRIGANQSGGRRQRIEIEITQIQRLSNNINMGWEMREIECVVEFHKPRQGVKRIIRLDTGEIVREQQMSGGELQEKLFPANA
jgi:hypothetical protein